MPDIRHSISIEASAEKIHSLFASGRGFARWWAADVAEDRSAGTVELGFFNRATVYRLKEVRITPLEAEWLCETGKEWKDTRLHFRLEPKNGRTVLRFSHAGWQTESDYFVDCNTTWGGLMFRLKAAAEGKASGPLFSASGLAY